MDTPPRDPAVVGRKVFFVRPHSVLQQELIETLVRAEFEVGLIKDQTKAEALFRRHPTCIAFLNIDEGWPLEEWDAFVARVLSDPVLQGVRLGIVTYNESQELAEHYLMDMELAAGFVKLNLGMAASTTIILKVLEANEARGRRQFLRVACQNENAEVNFQGAHRKITGTIHDLSVTGMACLLERDPGLKARTPVAELQIRLKGTSFTVSGVLMGSRKDEGGHTLFIFLFNPKDMTDAKDKVRAFLQGVVQRQLDTELKLL